MLYNETRFIEKILKSDLNQQERAAKIKRTKKKIEI
jgi:hypothetical protein